MAAVRNSLCEEPKDYDSLQFDVREVRPRLLPEAVDHALHELIVARAIWLSDDGRWTARR